jgi:hypothetical protein
MTRNRIGSLIVAALLLVPLVAQAQSARAHLDQMVQQLQSRPDDNRLREQIIELAKTIKPWPAITPEARSFFVKGLTITKAAQDAAGQELAVENFQKALKLAPWWGDAYYNLAVAQELAGQLDASEASLKLYLLTGPGATDAQGAQDRISALEAKRELAVQAQNAKAAAEAAEMANRTKQPIADPTTLICHLDAADGSSMFEDGPTTVEVNEAQSSIVVHTSGAHWRNPGSIRGGGDGQGGTRAVSIGPLQARFGTATITAPAGDFYGAQVNFATGKNGVFIIDRLTGAFVYKKDDGTVLAWTAWTCHPGKQQF